ncbi:adenylate/guanylate cyclase domain-containing protein [Winogradskyella sp.]|uniref:adenylate/guanylate cyclase domain-containing protein n=1 Tax=Winogradskyella sp. TaxID=1883156 RepID=UPI00262EFD51|nr:adenylate/guanylate cyclase domain-containing protein [Winogradskyella sp.]
MFSAKFIRSLSRYIPFVVIWCLFGVTYTLVEYGILGNYPTYPSTGNQYSFIGNLTYVFPATFSMGLLQGYLEMVWLKKRFQNSALWLKIITKTIIYILIIIVFLIVLTVLNSMDSFKEGPFGDHVINEFWNFFSVFAFWSIVYYTGLGVFFALLFAEIIDYLGSGVFYNFLFGKYHKPIEETRIFMFLDMKSSTSIAEKIGHQNYFKLISAYYSDMTNAIIESYGEIYQYVGDEIVISWKADKGIKNNNCIECFFRIKAAILKRKDFYLQTFGVFPEFKAGIHMGSVTTGEIGVLKKDIIYSGDVLNTAARIQSKCNIYNSECIVSKALKEALTLSPYLQLNYLGELPLKGKQVKVELYDLRQSQ